MPSSFSRHFAFPHPLFTRQKPASGVWWENSIYYLWWEFLRRNSDYQTTCENGGKGEYAELYADFGNVHEGTFREWWTKDDRGARLFAEPPLPLSVKALTPDKIAALPKGWDSGSLLVMIPLSLPKRFIEKKLGKLLARHHKRKKGQKTYKESRAPYPIGTTFRVASLKKLLDLYDLHQLQPDLKEWELAQKLRLGTTLNKDELEGERGRANPTAVEKKKNLSVAVSKKLRDAKSIIKGVGRGKFPAFSKHK
jgi:hypothetical protein